MHLRRHLLSLSLSLALLGCQSPPAPEGEAPSPDGADLRGADLTGVDLTRTEGSPDLRPATLGKSVLVFSGEGGLPGGTGFYLIPDFKALAKVAEPLGYTLKETGDWPADLRAYRAIFWFLPGATKAAGFTVPEPRVEALRAYLRDGGRLVIVGDLPFSYDIYEARNSHKVMNDLFSRLGARIRFSEALPSELGCAAPTHRLSQEVGRLSYNTSGDIRVAAPGAWVDCKGAAVQDLLCGEVLAVTDIQILSTGAESGGNARFVRNLLTVPGPSPCQP